jgi:hypothetical protein
VFIQDVLASGNLTVKLAGNDDFLYMEEVFVSGKLKLDGGSGFDVLESFDVGVLGGSSVKRFEEFFGEEDD